MKGILNQTKPLKYNYLELICFDLAVWNNPLRVSQNTLRRIKAKIKCISYTPKS